MQVERSGVRSVLFGNGTGRSPELRFTSPSADLRSRRPAASRPGLDGTYPPGLAVAQITDVDRATRARCSRGSSCKPLAGIDHSEFLLVLSQSAAMPPRPEEPASRPRKGRGGAAMRAEADAERSQGAARARRRDARGRARGDEAIAAEPMRPARSSARVAGRDPAAGQAVVHPAVAAARPAREPAAASAASRWRCARISSRSCCSTGASRSRATSASAPRGSSGC